MRGGGICEKGKSGEGDGENGLWEKLEEGEDGARRGNETG